MQMLRLGVLVFATASAFAADITGRWRAFVEGQDGNGAMYFSFRKDGER